MDRKPLHEQMLGISKCLTLQPVIRGVSHSGPRKTHIWLSRPLLPAISTSCRSWRSVPPSVIVVILSIRKSILARPLDSLATPCCSALTVPQSLTSVIDRSLAQPRVSVTTRHFAATGYAIQIPHSSIQSLIIECVRRTKPADMHILAHLENESGHGS